MFLTISILLAAFVVPEGWRLPVILLGAAVEFVETAVSIRISRRARPKVGPEALIDTFGEIVEPCRPLGRVRVRGEYWRARCESGADVGDRVRVLERSGLTLIVVAAGEAGVAP